MPAMPLSHRPEAATNPYRGRFREWYATIADWMLANPGGTDKDCAAALNRAPNTINMIRNTDLFRDYFQKRRQEWEQRHDFALRDKLHKTASLGLDILLETMDKKRDSIPIRNTTEIVTSALDRLGYAPQSGPSTQVNIQANGPAKVVVAPVAVDQLEEARRVLRVAQANRAAEPSSYLAPPSYREPAGERSEPLELSSEPLVGPEKEAEPPTDPSMEDDADGAPLTISAQ